MQRAAAREEAPKAPGGEEAGQEPGHGFAEQNRGVRFGVGGRREGACELHGNVYRTRGR